MLLVILYFMEVNDILLHPNIAQYCACAVVYRTECVFYIIK